MRADSRACSGFPTQPAVNFDYSSVTSARCRIRALCDKVGRQAQARIGLPCAPASIFCRPTGGRQGIRPRQPYAGFCFGEPMTIVIKARVQGAGAAHHRDVRAA